MENLMLQTGIGTKELDLLVAIVNNNPNKSLAYMLTVSKRLIKNINVTHAIVLGYLIGLTEGTEQVHAEYSKSLQLCRRQN